MSVLIYACTSMAFAGEGRSFLNRFWQTSEGMPSNVVSAVQRDADGFLWIATGAGVARFDGTRFEVFADKDGLPDTRITSLHIDRRVGFGGDAARGGVP